jgi:hypothetical protein
MPAIAALTVNDGAATPAAHTFNFSGRKANVVKWADRTSITPAGYRYITHEVREPASATGANRIFMGFSQPVEATADGVTSVVRVNSAQVILNLSQQSTLQEKKDLLAYVVNTLGLASMKTSVENLEPFYG